MSGKNDWVDFRQVRESVNFGAVLEAYGVTLKLKGDQHHGFCPLPDHNGQKRSPSFSAHLGKKAFQCFGCQGQGNAIDFVALMEGLNPADPRDIRQAALLIQERFLHASPSPKRHIDRAPPKLERKWIRPSRPQSGPTSTEVPSKSPTAEPKDNRPRVINAPLDFELKNLDPNHPYLQERGLTPDTIRHFGLGFCNKGLMAGRIAIPLRNGAGRLIGYAGRIVDESLIGEAHPKYKLPGSREKDGTLFEFSKSAFLFNSDHIQAPVSDLVVVEGFFGVFHLHQCGFANAVALMGSSCSTEQADLILKLTESESRIWIMPDGDPAGQLCLQSVIMQVAAHRFIRWIKLEDGTDPNDYPPEVLANWLMVLA